MANESNPAKKIYSAHVDAIRIVPLFVADTVSQPTAEAAAAAVAATGISGFTRCQLAAR